MFNRNYYSDMHKKVTAEEYDRLVSWNAAYVVKLGKKPKGKTIISYHISEVAYVDFSKVSHGFFDKDSDYRFHLTTDNPKVPASVS